MNEFKSKFTFFEKVYLISDTDNKPRIVKSIQFIPNGVPNYEIESGSSSSWHYENSLSRKPTEHDFTKPVGFNASQPKE